MSSVFFLLYFASTSNMLLLSHAADSSSSSSSGDDTTGGGGGPPPLPPSNDKHTVHLMEVWTNNAADAYTIAPMLLRTGTYNNILRVRWYWNKPCIGKHIILYVYTDDTKYFNETTSSQRPELEWLEAALGTYMDKVFMLLFHSYPMQNSAHTAHLDQHSQNLADIDLRTFDSSCGRSSSDGDDEQSTTEPIRSKPHLHVSNKYVVRNEDGTVNQQQSILAIAQVNNVKCELLKAACEKTRHWLPCFTYNIFCKGKNKLATSFTKQLCRDIAKACHLDEPEAVEFCKLKNLFCSHQHDY
eukprot:gene13349-14726_t